MTLTNTFYQSLPEDANKLSAYLFLLAAEQQAAAVAKSQQDLPQRESPLAMLYNEYHAIDKETGERLKKTINENEKYPLISMEKKIGWWDGVVTPAAELLALGRDAESDTGFVREFWGDLMLEGSVDKNFILRHPAAEPGMKLVLTEGLQELVDGLVIYQNIMIQDIQANMSAEYRATLELMINRMEARMKKKIIANVQKFYIDFVVQLYPEEDQPGLELLLQAGVLARNNLTAEIMTLPTKSARLRAFKATGGLSRTFEAMAALNVERKKFL